jgi:hypothetical protein
VSVYLSHIQSSITFSSNAALLDAALGTPYPDDTRGIKPKNIRVCWSVGHSVYLCPAVCLRQSAFVESISLYLSSVLDVLSTLCSTRSPRRSWQSCMMAPTHPRGVTTVAVTVGSRTSNTCGACVFFFLGGGHEQKLQSQFRQVLAPAKQRQCFIWREKSGMDLSQPPPVRDQQRRTNPSLPPPPNGMGDYSSRPWVPENRTGVLHEVSIRLGQCHHSALPWRRWGTATGSGCPLVGRRPCAAYKEPSAAS